MKNFQNIKTVAIVTGISKAKIKEMIQKGHISYELIGGHYHVDAFEIYEVLDKRYYLSSRFLSILDSPYMKAKIRRLNKNEMALFCIDLNKDEDQDLIVKVLKQKYVESEDLERLELIFKDGMESLSRTNDKLFMKHFKKDFMFLENELKGVAISSRSSKVA